MQDGHQSTEHAVLVRTCTVSGSATIPCADVSTAETLSLSSRSDGAMPVCSMLVAQLMNARSALTVSTALGGGRPAKQAHMRMLVDDHLKGFVILTAGADADLISPA